MTSPLGELILGVWDNQLVLCDWRYRKMRESIDKRIEDGLQAVFMDDHHPLFLKVEMQFADYFEGKRQRFEIPLLMVGTDFQKRVWTALMEVPYGNTETYLQLSKRLGDEKAIRAVASANGANAISIIIPCHRIVGSKGEMMGYAGGILAKKKLLKLENNGQRPEQLELF